MLWNWMQPPPVVSSGMVQGPPITIVPVTVEPGPPGGTTTRQIVPGGWHGDGMGSGVGVFVTTTPVAMWVVVGLTPAWPRMLP
jgi:hypothetical protein